MRGIHFEPSAWRLTKMIEAAELKFESSRELERRRQEERENEIYARGWAAEVKARHYRLLRETVAIK